MSETKFPKIPDFLDERLDDEFGIVVTSIDDPTIIHSTPDRSKINAMIKVLKSSLVDIGDIVLIYDFIRGQIIAAEIDSHIIKSTDEKNNVEHLFNRNAEPGYKQFKAKRYDFLRTPHLFELKPLKLLEFEGNELQPKGSVKFAPCPQAPLFQPTDRELLIVLGLKEEGIIFGLLGKENELHLFERPNTGDEYVMPIRISEEALTRHISINGVSGGGKTILLKILIYQFAQRKMTVLLTDTQGDFVAQIWRDDLAQWQMDEIHDTADHLELMLQGMNIDYGNIGVDPSKINVFYPSYVSPDDIYLWDLRRNGITPIPLNLPSSLITNWATLATIMDLNSVQLQGLEILFNAFSGLNTQVQDEFEFSLDEFINWLERIYISDSNDAAQTQQRLPRGLETIARGTIGVILRQLLNLQNRNVLDTDRANPTRYNELLERGKINILYLPGEETEVDVRPLIQLLVYNEIYRNRSRDNYKRIILIDEAQEVIPAGRGKKDRIASELAKQFTSLAEQGRKYGLCLIVASQQPKRIHPVVFSQCSTRIFLKLTEEDIQALSKTIHDKYKQSLILLKTGSALLISPQEIERGSVWLKFPLPPVFHLRPNELKQQLRAERRSIRDEPSKPVSTEETSLDD